MTSINLKTHRSLAVAEIKDYLKNYAFWFKGSELEEKAEAIVDWLLKYSPIIERTTTNIRDNVHIFLLENIIPEILKATINNIPEAISAAITEDKKL